MVQVLSGEKIITSLCLFESAYKFPISCSTGSNCMSTLDLLLAWPSEAEMNPEFMVAITYTPGVIVGSTFIEGSWSHCCSGF